MKKSEVLDKISSILVSHLEIYDKICDDISLDILNNIEELGMLPATVWSLDEECYYSTKVITKQLAEEDKGYIFEWEKE